MRYYHSILYYIIFIYFFPPFFSSFFSTTGATKLAVLTKLHILEWYSPLWGAIWLSAKSCLIPSLANELKGKLKN